jgi:hypothetical protein
MYIFQNRDKAMPPRSNLGQGSPQRYLGFWGNDYVYLSKNSVQRWLPIPENSKAQRLIRNFNRESNTWVVGKNFIMGPTARSWTLSNPGMVG